VKLTDLELGEDLLYLFVFGPGFGESVVLRVPPNEWVVVDSLRHQTKQEDANPALRLLAAHDATVAAIALTHRHRDHAHGLYQLLDRRRQGSPVGRTDVFATPDEDWRGSQDASLVLDTGTVASLLNRIDHIWLTDPPSEWPLVEGATRAVGDATIEVLSPPPNSKPKRGDLNLLSSAMLVTWSECRILLGADLPVAGWRSVAKSVPCASGLATSHALKVAHHASKGAQHATAIGVPPPRDRVCVATPFNHGHQLPNYADDHGVDLLLRTHVAVGVTAVPPSVRGASTPRRKMQPKREQFGELTLTHEVTKAVPSQAWIASAFDRDGMRVNTWLGDAAGSVVA